VNGRSRQLPDAVPVVPSGMGLLRTGDAIRGIGEAFSTSSVTGSASLTIPLPLTRGRGGFGPSLSLGYNGGGGNGLYGLGWSIGSPAVVRRTDCGLPTYDDVNESDTFMLGGQQLVPALVDEGSWNRDERDAGTHRVLRYRQRAEGSFARIERWIDQASGETHWRSVSPDNVTSVYGRSAGARVADPATASRVFSWLLEESFDDKGNVVSYEYKAEDLAGVAPTPSEAHRLAADGSQPAARHLKRIRYGNRVPGERAQWLFTVVFDYGDHASTAPTVADDRPWPARPDPFSTYRAGFELRSYRLCRRVLMFHDFSELGPGPTLVRSLDLTYEEDAAGSRLTSVEQAGYVREGVGYRREALPAVLLEYTRLRMGGRIETADDRGLPALFLGGEAVQQWLDLEEEGLPGLVIEDDGAWFFKRNLGGGRFAPARHVSSRPTNAGFATGGQTLLALPGAEETSLVDVRPGVRGYSERATDGWRSLRPFRTFPGAAWGDARLRLIDLTGDGAVDLLEGGEDVFRWYPAVQDGFGAPRRVPEPPGEDDRPAAAFADGALIQVADMSGDGLADLVRVRNGQVCYWPNLGRGRFGRKVTMAVPPVFDDPNQFDERRIRLADVDGSGTTDLVYLGHDGVTVWLNQSGNSWSAGERVGPLPDAADVSLVQVLDLLGTGTGTIVWPSPEPGGAGSTRYIQLLPEGKPHLLQRVDNNQGGEVELAYAPSTRFFLEDEAAGRPWATRLPFPVHVVAAMTTRDRITGTELATSYRYHHGYFDRREREFRGFGMVEQWDAPTAPVQGTVAPPADDAPPPVYTKTWFDTGVHLPGTSLAQLYAEEYYAGDPAGWRLAPAELPEGLDAESLRGVLRALAGSPLRQEVYAGDGTTAAAHPYTVAERRSAIRLLQPAADGHPASFHAFELEALEHYYERRPDDPRVSHRIALDVDPFGATRRSASLSYPRRAPLFPEQARLAAVVTESDLVHDADSPGRYRLSLPVEGRTYELTGLSTPGGRPFAPKEIAEAVGAAATIAPETSPTGFGLQKRLLDRVRHRYYADDLSGPLPLGQVGVRALPYRTDRLAFTPVLLTEVFGTLVDDALLTGEGHYVKDDGVWWAPSSRVLLDPAAFFNAVGMVDERGSQSSTDYDSYGLLPVRATDPAGNSFEAQNHYRVMSPWSIIDPNGNRRAVRFDAIGRVIATADMGRDDAADGDQLVPTSSEPAPGDDPTSRIEYRTTEWVSRRRPTCIRTVARDRHRVADATWHESFSYLDGAGQEVMTKSQAEPGPAPTRAADGSLVRDAAGKLVVAEVPGRWVGTGRIVYDAKGRAVRSYEPFFSSTPEYEDEAELVEWGVSPLMQYDPLGRAVRVDYPDGTLTRRSFDAWRHEVWDQNDTVSESAWHTARQAASAPVAERRADELAVAHRQTPTGLHVDSSGRDYPTVAAAGAAGELETRVELDAGGQPLSITDPRGIVVMRARYDVLGRRLQVQSVDGGASRGLPDASGRAIRSWNSRGISARCVYDLLGRLTHLFVRAGAAPERLTERIVYGEALPDAAARNLRARPYRRYDAAGAVTTEAHDFKGNVLRASRRLAADPHGVSDWSAIAAATTLAAVEAAAEPLLESETFTVTTEYDAFNRAVSMVTPDGSETLPSYNAAGLAERVDVRIRGSGAATTFLSGLTYNARGQREGALLGNGVAVAQEYDPLTFRVSRLRAGEGAIQDLAYTYDPVGNVVEVADGAHQSTFFAGVVADPKLQFEYDSIYRLTAAEGREQLGDGQPSDADVTQHDLPLPAGPPAARRYRQSYGYDEGGNILAMGHAPTGGTGWTRRYAYAPASNRLESTSVPGDLETAPFSAHYTYDERGNVTSMPHLPTMQWDEKDRLVKADLGGGGTVYYVYDSGGQRVRKVVERLGSLVEETIYLGGYERFRRRTAAGLVNELHTLEISDGGRRLALIETVTVEGGAAVQPVPTIRYQLHNRLGSASVELDAAGAVLTYEEYYPYGGTSYAATRAGPRAHKRYRFGGHERDAETGLYYCSARFYAPWLGRWVSADPAGLGDGTNLYAFARNNPATYSDPTGTETRHEELPNQALDFLSNFGIRTDHGDGGGRSFWDRLGDALSSLWNAVTSAVSAAWNWLAGAATTAWEWIKGASSTAWTWVKGAATSAWNWLKGAAVTVGRWAAGAAVTAWEWTKHAVTAAWNWVRGAAASAWNWIKGAAASAWDWTKRAIAAAWNWTKGAVSTAWNWIKGAARSVWEFTKAAAAWTWNWILAPAIRTATNVLAGAALGFWIGGPVGALIGGIAGLVTGAVHAWSMAYAGSYDWSEPASWAMFLIDNTWSLPNSVVGSLFSTLNVWNEIDTSSARQGRGQLYYKSQWFSPFDTTFGNVTVGLVVPRHEATHGLQGRIFGPLFYPLVVAHYAVNIVLPVWAIYHDHKGHPIHNLKDYFERGVYGHHWIEEWAYQVEGRRR
jgi:RHS repeat-associated protein